MVAKRTKKNDPQQKNKRDTEFSEEMGSAKANKAHKEKAKQKRKDGWAL